MKTKLTIMIVIALLAASATWALAQTDGVIYACVMKNGTMRIVSDPAECMKNETLLSWNIMGPKGDPGLACWDLDGDGIQDLEEDINLDGVWDAADCKGPQGETGPTGAEGAQGPQGEIGPMGPTGPVANRQLVPEANSFTNLDSAGDVGTSITIGADGLPVISYYDATNLDLKVAHCSDLACSSAALKTLDSAGDVGTSITIGADGLPVISYFDATNHDLKVAHCSDLTCSSAALKTLDSAGDVGYYTSITIGADGLPVTSYYDYTNRDLKVARCANAFCMPYFRRR